MEKGKTREELTLEERFVLESKYYDEQISKKLHLDEVEKVYMEEGFRAIYPEVPNQSQFLVPMVVCDNLLKSIGITLDEKIYRELEYEVDAEWTYRVMIDGHENARRVMKYHPPLPHEVPLVENFTYLSFPPVYKISPSVGAAVNTQLFGKSATMMWSHVNDFTRELYWIHGFHIEDGVQSRGWILSSDHDLEERYDEADHMLYQGVGYGEHATREEYWKIPPNMDVLKYGGGRKAGKASEFLHRMVTGTPIGEMSDRQERRHFATGVKIKDIPKHAWDPFDWAKATNEFTMDMRMELLPEFQNATNYTSAVQTLIAMIAQQVLMTSTFGWDIVYLALFLPEVLGLNYCAYAEYPFPAIFNLFAHTSMETYATRLTALATGYEIYQPIQLNEEKVPLEWRIRKYLWEHGPFSEMVMGAPDGAMLTPRSIARMITPVVAPEGRNIRTFLVEPPSEEFWEILESDEVGADRETGRIPPITEVLRLSWVADPTDEPIPTNKFPKIDLGVGQVWPLDMTLEKVEIMVEEGYSGLGDNIEHYSKLADKKMGKKDVEVPEYKPLSDYAKSYRKELGEVHPIYLEHL